MLASNGLEGCEPPGWYGPNDRRQLRLGAMEIGVNVRQPHLCPHRAEEVLVLALVSRLLLPLLLVGAPATASLRAAA